MRDIRSAANPLLVRLRRLARDPAGYRPTDELWLEGEHLVSAWAAAGRPIALAVVSESRASEPAVLRLVSRAAESIRIPDALFAGLSALESPAGIGVVGSRPAGPAVDPLAATLVLDRVQDPGNVGTLLRTAAAMGLGQVLALVGTAALWSPKVLRGGMGAHLSLNLVEGLSVSDLSALRMPLVGTLPQGQPAIWSTRLPWPVAWVLGHEGQGLAPAVQALCAFSVTIPQPGGEESLNVATAGALCLYESARQRLAPSDVPGGNRPACPSPSS
jgi:RNA methyltransferase, TrmH family